MTVFSVASWLYSQSTHDCILNQLMTAFSVTSWLHSQSPHDCSHYTQCFTLILCDCCYTTIAGSTNLISAIDTCLDGYVGYNLKFLVSPWRHKQFHNVADSLLYCCAPKKRLNDRTHAHNFPSLRITSPMLLVNITTILVPWVKKNISRSRPHFCFYSTRYIHIYEM